jgi:hypothetical protein
MGWIAANLANPPGWPTHALAAAALLWVCWDARFPGGGSPWGSLGGLVWACVLLVWLTRLAAGLVLRLWWLWSGQPTRPLLDGWRHWCVVPLLLGVNCAAIACALPSRVAFRISRPALDRLAQAVAADRKERPKQWAGVIPISRAQLVKGAVQLDYDRKELPWGQRGLYFSLDGAAVDNSYYRFQEKLEGRWYTWHYNGW